MNAPFIPQNAAASFNISNMFQPSQGGKAYAIDLNFSNDAVLNGDLETVQADGSIESIQSIKIDNSQNPTTFQIVFYGAGRAGDRIIVQPYKTGYYPVTAPHGALRYSCLTTPGIVIPVIFYNVPLPYFEWGPSDGNVSLPTLLNKSVSLRPALVGDNILIPGVALQNIKIYRVMIGADNAANVSFKSGATELMGQFSIFAGGSVTMVPGGAIPWFVCGVGEDFIMTADAAVNFGGTIGYTQN